MPGRLVSPIERGYNPEMPRIDDIRAKIAGDQFEFPTHAVDQAILRGISRAGGS